MVRDPHPDAQHGRMLKGLGRSSGPPLLLRNGTVRPQPPDGSCLFHSLCFGLSRIAAARNVPTSTDGLRSNLARWVGTHASLLLVDTPLSSWVQWDSGLSTEAYASRMERSGWGGGIEIAACSHLFAVNIWVYEERRGGGFERISSFGTFVLERTLHVLYKGRNHYDVLLPDEGELSSQVQAPTTVPSTTVPGVPGASVLGATVPRTMEPSAAVLGAAVLGASAPGASAPGASAPGASAPGASVPGVTLPGVTVPRTTVPSGTVLGASVVPGESVPAATVPGATVLGVLVPGVTVPPGVTVAPSAEDALFEALRMVGVSRVMLKKLAELGISHKMLILMSSVTDLIDMTGFATDEASTIFDIARAILSDPAKVDADMDVDTDTEDEDEDEDKEDEDKDEDDDDDDDDVNEAARCCVAASMAEAASKSSKAAEAVGLMPVPTSGWIIPAGQAQGDADGDSCDSNAYAAADPWGSGCILDPSYDVEMNYLDDVQLSQVSELGKLGDFNFDSVETKAISQPQVPDDQVPKDPECDERLVPKKARPQSIFLAPIPYAIAHQMIFDAAGLKLFPSEPKGNCLFLSYGASCIQRAPTFSPEEAKHPSIQTTNKVLQMRKEAADLCMSDAQHFMVIEPGLNLAH